MVFDNFFNFIFGPILKLGAAWSVIIISFILSCLILLFYKLFTDQKLMKSLKEEIKAIQEEAKKFREDPAKSLEISKKAMEKNMILMRHSMRPTLYTFVPLIIIFSWLRNSFKGMGDVVTWGFSIPLFGIGLGWLGLYIISSIIFSVVLRKLLKIY